MKSIGLVLLLLLQILFFYFFGKSSILLGFSSWSFDFQGVALSFLSKVAFSVGDLLYVLAAAFVIWQLYKCFKKRKKSAIFYLLIMLNLCYAYYQLQWGLFYHQPAISCKKNAENTNLKELVFLAQKYSQLAAKTRRAYSYQPQFKIEKPDELFDELLKNQSQLPLILQKKQMLHQPLKRSLFSSAMNYTGILGYYNPFTHEAQYNFSAPDSSLPFTMGHEFAHAMGYAREQEANYISFKMSALSHNLAYRYSGQLYALKSLLGACKQADLGAFKQVKQQLDPLVMGDILHEKAFYKAHETWLTDVFFVMNDFFLKSNQQEGSVTYSYFVYLLLSDEAA